MPLLRRLCLSATCAALALAGLGCSSKDGGVGVDYDEVTLLVRGASDGTGTGRVVASDLGVDCQVGPGVAASGACERTIEDAGLGGVFDAIATPDAGSSFVGWTLASCSSTMAGECDVDCGAGDASTSCTLSFSADAENTRFTLNARFDEDVEDAVVLEDDFDAVDPCAAWTATVTSSTGTATASEDCVATGGDLDTGWRRMTHQIDGVGSVVVFHRYDAATYDPSTQGAITRLDYSWSAAVTAPAFAGAGVGHAVGVEQGGTLYTHSLGAFTHTAWSLTSGSLTAADFVPAPGPDFSASGGPIRFGYLRSNTNTSAGVQINGHGIDNWRMVIVR